MSSLVLRTLAILTMLTDHLGVAYGWSLLDPLSDPVYIGMRLIGRLAMPIFCFLIAEGLFHTRSASRYAGRLLLFAFLAEIPFDWCFSQGARLFDWEGQNVFFTLFLGLLAIWLYDRFALKGQYLLSLMSLLLCAFLAELIRSDYGMFGVLFVFVFYCFRDRPVPRTWAFAGVCLLMGVNYYLTARWPDPVSAVLMCCAAAAALPIWLYNGQKGRIGKKDRGGRVLQIAFYAFYPVHLTLIALLASGRMINM